MTRTAVVVRQVRQEHGLSQEDLGAIAGRSRSWVNEIEAGNLNGDPTALVRVGRRLKDGRLILEAARRVTAGAYVGPVLDGVAADTYPAAVLAKAEEELREALAAVQALQELRARPVAAWTEAHHREADRLLEQLLDAERCIECAATVIERERGRDVVALYQRHDAKLAQRRYTQEEAAHVRDGRP